MTNDTDDRVSYAQARELLGEMRRLTADFYKTWALPGGALMYAMFSADDETPVAKGYLSEAGDNRPYVMEVVA